MAEPIFEAPSEEPEGTTEPAEAPPEILKQKQLKHHCRRRRRRRRRSTNSFTIYFHRVLKNVHQGLSLSQEAVSVMDSFVKDMFERIIDEASHLVRNTQRATINLEEIETAVRLLLPGKLGRFAVHEGTNAVLRYICHK
ncbi:PREDICTED: late histone H2B.L4-like [Hipposideros armiger]|uniref:Late histone H2B.L4-like n=1 Tax=Hipposideros armiger TaxID=186990 RepID=A0A8B7QLM1_HIPAR|nr:PREDICTED: late histone H2B.L4-like [Hipposideros armiger]